MITYPFPFERPFNNYYSPNYKYTNSKKNSTKKRFNETSLIKDIPSINNNSNYKQKDSFNFFNLESDDILLISILFFLYTQKVDDPILFISLILLLIT